MTPITNFEAIESLRFFGALVSTPEITHEAKEIANGYILKLLKSMDESVTKMCQTDNSIQVVKGFGEF